MKSLQNGANPADAPVSQIDASQKYHEVEQLNPVPTWSDSHGNHHCKKFSAAEVEVESHDQPHKNLESWKSPIPP